MDISSTTSPEVRCWTADAAQAPMSYRRNVNGYLAGTQDPGHLSDVYGNIHKLRRFTQLIRPAKD